MKRLKGALSIYLKQDILLTFLPLILTLIMFYIDYATFNKTDGFKFEIKDYIRNVSMMIFFDYNFSFMTRYIMHLNFNSSRKTFFNSIKFMAMIKSFIMALFGTLMIIYVRGFCELKDIKYSIEVFGQKYQHITFLQGVIVLISLLIFILAVFSLAILTAAINKMGYILLMISGILVSIIYSKVFYKTLENIYYYIIVNFVFLIVSIINFKISWRILKRKSDMENCWFAKLCESLNPNNNG